MYLSSGADLMDPYPDAAAPAAGPMASSSAFKKAARAMLASGNPPGPFAFVVTTLQGTLQLSGGSYPTEAAALADLQESARNRSYAKYIGVFRREAGAPGGWAEVKTLKVTAQGNRFLVPALAAGAGITLLWLLSRSSTRARARRGSR